jgi:hypothetical protein
MKTYLELLLGLCLLPLTLPCVALLCLFPQDGDNVST